MKKIALILIAFLTFGAQAQTFEVHGPKIFSEIMEQTYNASWSPAGISAVENLKHIVLLDAATELNAVLVLDADAAGIEIKNVDQLSGSSATYNSALRGMFQLVDINANTEDALAGEYRIHPILNSYHALNADESTIVSSDAGSYYAGDGDGYLTFTFDGSTTSTTIKATAQYEYNNSTGKFESNNSWTEQWLMISSESLKLTSDEVSATAFYLADALDLIDVSLSGSDFNPESIEWQDNEFASYPDDVWGYDESALFGEQFLSEVDESYQTQFGNSDEANTAAEEALDEIQATLNEDEESLRYDKSVYLEFRDNLLARTFGAGDIYNSKIGESTVEDVYFTNATDDDGVPHPFMVIASHNASDGPNFLIDVARPPAAGDDGGYEDQPITRNAVLEVKLVKIPLKDYGLIDELEDNDLTPYGSLAGDMNLDASEYDVLNYSGTASNGVAIDGVVIYPAYNNNLRVASADAEITSTGIHVGRGMGLHYHADGHGYNGNGINLYNYSDYDNQDHPPLIGFSYDGLALFGKYESNYPDMEGYDEDLDEYGGHDHSDFGYHYHAFGGQMTYEDKDGVTIGPFTQHYLLVGAWKGLINDIPGFSEVSTAQLKEEDTGRYAGAPYDEVTDPENPEEVLAIRDNELGGVNVYPNPSQGSLTINTVDIYKLSLIDLNGQLIWSKSLTEIHATTEIELLPKGFFVLKGEGNQSSIVQKVIVE